jgi:single-stranded-DNA-specific exonuclease
VEFWRRRPDLSLDRTPDIQVPAGLQSAVGGHSLLAQALAGRGYLDPAQAQAFLDPGRYIPASPFDLPGMQPAVERLEAGIRAGENICVWGDFDVDGQTATTVLFSTLKDLDARVTYHIPVRERESHGVNLPVLREIIAGGVQLILTCDTGISAQDSVEYANTRGVDVIVTDHHELPVQLPDALAVVNPKLLPAGHPAGSLPGVGVAYLLAQVLYERAGRPGGADQHLDLAALGSSPTWLCCGEMLAISSSAA